MCGGPDREGHGIWGCDERAVAKRFDGSQKIYSYGQAFQFSDYPKCILVFPKKRARKPILNPAGVWTDTLLRRMVAQRASKTAGDRLPAAVSWNQLRSAGLVLTIRPHRGSVGVHFGAEVAQRDERFRLAGVLKGQAVFQCGSIPPWSARGNESASVYSTAGHSCYDHPADTLDRKNRRNLASRFNCLWEP